MAKSGVSSVLLHHKLGHIGLQALHWTVGSKGVTASASSIQELHFCDHYALPTTTSLHHKAVKPKRETRVFYRFSSDVCGSMGFQTRSGKKCFVTFICAA
jgi:hypothetical protein